MLRFGSLSEKQKATNAFNSNAKVADGVGILGAAEFAKAISPPSSGHYFNESQSGLLFKAADLENKKQLTLDQFLGFDKLFDEPNSEYKILARLIDPGASELNVGKIKAFFTKSFSGTPINFESEPLHCALGNDDKRPVSLDELSQLIKIIRYNRVKGEFIKFDPKKTGYINSTDLILAVTALFEYKMNPTLKDNISKYFSKVSYTEYSAIVALLSRTNTIAQILTQAKSSANNGVSPVAFAIACMKRLDDQFTPLEISTMFKMINGGEPVVDSDLFAPLIDPSYSPEVVGQEVPSLTAGMQILKSAFSFALGSIAGAVGASVVYPIDLVKTRMQNQRKAKMVGQVLYKNGIDCFRKVVRNEGVTGLYSGLLPQLVGVAPEKAIKLTMNDLVRSIIKDKKSGDIPIAGEILAGCCAGGSQVMFTNPLEIVKIRLQVQGEVAKSGLDTPRMSAAAIVRQLGLVGLYKGVGACILRDVPFSGIYFPTYAHLKKNVFHEGHNGKKLSIPELLVAGAIAGIPAAYLVTPADVIKTRLQVQARKGEQTYTGIRDAFVKILKEEGPAAFYKGGVARVLRSSPQFGVTLAVYEFLQKSIPLDFGDRPKDKSVAPSHKWSVHDIGKQNSLTLLGDLSLKA